MRNSIDASRPSNKILVSVGTPNDALSEFFDGQVGYLDTNFDIPDIDLQALAVLFVARLTLADGRFSSAARGREHGDLHMLAA